MVDVVDALRDRNDSDFLIYGANPTSAFARKFYSTNSSVNPMAGVNADNYAWYVTNYILRDAWGAENDPFNYLDRDDYLHLGNPKKRRSSDAAVLHLVNLLYNHNHKRQDAEQQEAIEDLNEWPRNCIWTDEEDDDLCEEILDIYDEWVPGELGTTLSPQCQSIDPNAPFTDLNAVHPDCKCKDNASGDDVRLYDINKCKGFVGVEIGCRDAGDGGCDCRTNLNDGPHHMDAAAMGDRTCSSLSRGGMTEQDIDDLIATGG